MADRPHPDQEPSAAMRDFASNVWDMYLAMIQAGFSEDQAMSTIRDVVRTALGNAMGD